MGENAIMLTSMPAVMRLLNVNISYPVRAVSPEVGANRCYPSDRHHTFAVSKNRRANSGGQSD